MDLIADLKEIGRYYERVSLVILLLVAFPSLAGAFSYYGFRVGLIGIYLLLALLVVLVSLKGSNAGDEFIYLAVIQCISLCLLLSSALASGTLRGYDIHDEFFQYLQTRNSGFWNLFSNDPYNAVLSVTILPTFVSVLSGLNGLQIFQLILPLIFSLTPIVLYKVYRKILQPKPAFLAVFLFMSYSAFYNELVSLGRQEIAEFLLVLLLLVLLERKLSVGLQGRLGIFLLTLGLFMSQYSLAYLFLFILAVSVVVSKLTRLRGLVSNVSLGVLMILLIGTLAWYTHVGGGVDISSLTSGLGRVMQNSLSDLFDLGSRGSVLVNALTISGSPGLLHDTNRFVQYMVQFCLILGFAFFARKHMKSVEETDLLSFMPPALLLLVATVALPFFGGLLNLSRIYNIALIFVAPCFLFGVDAISAAFGSLQFVLPSVKLPRINAHVARTTFAATILICYFLFVSGWAWSASAETPTSFILDSQRMRSSSDISLQIYYYSEFTQPEDIAAARWILEYASPQARICSDYISMAHVLNSYGERPRYGEGSAYDFQYRYNCIKGSYIYLSQFNTLSGLALTNVGGLNIGGVGGYPVSSDVNVTILNRIYSDGAAILN
jgi:uncharacterized membrane protein